MIEVVKPMRMYASHQFSNRIEVGNIVLAQVILYDEEFVTLKVKERDARMYIKDYDRDCFDDNYKKKSISANIGRNILARVVSIDEEGMILLERKSVANETTDILKSKIGQTIYATVERRMDYGLFIDIGNGISSLIPAMEVARCRQKFHSAFSVGDVLKVKVLEYNTENNFFLTSRKQAYSPITFEKGEKAVVTCCSLLPDKSGIYVEYDPANAGIMDVPEILLDVLTYGTEVEVYIKKMNDFGFKCNFIHMV